jgi:hypothetical protein
MFHFSIKWNQRTNERILPSSFLPSMCLPPTLTQVDVRTPIIVLSFSFCCCLVDIDEGKVCSVGSVGEWGSGQLEPTLAVFILSLTQMHCKSFRPEWKYSLCATDCYHYLHLDKKLLNMYFDV